MTKTKPFDTNLSPAEFKSRIISALRQASRWRKPKQEAIARARVGRGKYKCEQCWTVWPLTLPPEAWKKKKRKNIQADHIREVVPVTGFTTYDNWIERCFVWADWFEALCHQCHYIKTQQENKQRRAIKKWEEVWRESGLYKWYIVSSKWRIKGRNWKILTWVDNWNWYYKITIWKSKKEYIHRLVAEAFIWDIEWMHVCHIDDNPYNNVATNLFIWTAQDNIDDKVKKWRHIIWWKTVYQYSLKWELIKEWEWWVMEVERVLWYNNSNIYNACDWKYKQSYWFIWKRA